MEDAVPVVPPVEEPGAVVTFRGGGACGRLGGGAPTGRRCRGAVAVAAVDPPTPTPLNVVAGFFGGPELKASLKKSSDDIVRFLVP